MTGRMTGKMTGDLTMTGREEMTGKEEMTGLAETNPMTDHDQETEGMIMVTKAKMTGMPKGMTGKKTENPTMTGRETEKDHNHMEDMNNRKEVSAEEEIPDTEMKAETTTNQTIKSRKDQADLWTEVILNHKNGNMTKTQQDTDLPQDMVTLYPRMLTISTIPKIYQSGYKNTPQ